MVVSRRYYQSIEPSPFVNVLTTDGLPTGPSMATGDYSDTGAGVTDFFFQCPANAYVEINSFRIIVSDAGNPQRTEYGNMGAALTNGVRAFFTDFGQPEEEVTPGLRPLKSSQDFERVAINLEEITYATDNSKAYEVILIGAIKLDAGDRFAIRLNDDFSGLADHQFVIIGSERGL